MVTKRIAKMQDELNCTLSCRNPGGSTLQNNGCTATCISFLKQFKEDEKDMSVTAEEAKTTSKARFSDKLLHLD